MRRALFILSEETACSQIGPNRIRLKVPCRSHYQVGTIGRVNSKRPGGGGRTVKPWSRRSLGMLLISLIPASAAAYDHPLDSSAIRNAYFLGSSNSESVKFISKYKETLPPPKTGPYIAEMEVRTPFAQVVVSSREHSVGYSPMQAEQDYKKDPDTLQVRIQIRFTTFGAPLWPPPACQGVNRMTSVQDCFHNFDFRFSQGKDLQPIRSYGAHRSTNTC